MKQLLAAALAISFGVCLGFVLGYDPYALRSFFGPDKLQAYCFSFDDKRQVWDRLRNPAEFIPPSAKP